MIGQTALGLVAFRGAWDLARIITDHRSGTMSRFDGTAVFTPDDDGLSYFESGQLYLPGQSPFQAERRYHWREVEGVIHVFFDDGRFFHSFDDAHPAATHWCDPDTYDVAYDFTEWPKWRSTWNVLGPRKAYEMINDYTRTAV
ncbi:DUF6314 family protein [Marivita sp.]|uniref:DUF6314 family protein n=1 Tax=Marivita sp. TaxID=2003365 RepID=UPI003F6AAFB5